MLIAFNCSSSSDKDEVIGFDDVNCDSNYGYDVDIDEDGVIDFNFNCGKAFPGAVLGNEDGHLFGNIQPMDDAFVLIKNLDGPLFLGANESFTSQIEGNDYYWSWQSWFIVNRKWRENSGWDDNWYPMSNSNRYYIGFKLQNNEVNKLGWMELLFDPQTGEITILQKDITTEDTITIN